ncbi:MAG: hypothetical protein A2X86_09950 [Bdellovibrionales bacterium GWA2_49_15]|nr:MAG: hypothetical protein A2X86_09950 [Bdellovibrionales bacterium GWA2_49_15]HAZ13105.1 integrase [Bdellovibrionales bacterium]
MKIQKSLPQYIEAFFQEHLAVHRGVSPNTIKSYRDVVKLFLLFIGKTQSKPITKIKPEDLTVEVVLLFLKDIESTRKNGAITRNHRLAALRVFFTYLATSDVMNIGQYQRILLIPQKRTSRPMMGYLEVDEINAIFKEIDRSTWGGQRDYVLLNLLYNTGARVQEICDLKVESIRLDSPPLATICGKGKKTRQVPLWPETKKLLIDYFHENNLMENPETFLFQNQRGNPIGRFGVRYVIDRRVRNAIKICSKLAKKTVTPHTFRHTTAMHLLQSGVELTVIRSWLGHVDIATTHSYVEIDMEMKRRALEKCNPVKGSKNGLGPLLNKNKDIIGWLETL